MPTSAKLLAEMKLLHPQLIDLSLGRVERLLGKLGDPAQEAAARRAHRRHQRQGLGHRLPQGHARSGGRARARLHLAASRALPRAHRARRRRAARRRPIGEETLVDVLTRTQAINGSDDITQFEITTAAAFLAFAEHPADVLLLEVGLGGRLDATNVVDAPGARRHHADLARSLREARRHACRRSRPRRPASCVAACRRSSRSRSRRPRTSSAPRRCASARRSSCGASTSTPTSSAAASSCSGRSSCSICRCRRSSAATRSSTPAPPSPRRCGSPPTCRIWVSTSAPSSRG